MWPRADERESTHRVLIGVRRWTLTPDPEHLGILPRCRMAGFLILPPWHRSPLACQSRSILKDPGVFCLRQQRCSSHRFSPCVIVPSVYQAKQVARSVSSTVAIEPSMMQELCSICDVQLQCNIQSTRAVLIPAKSSGGKHHIWRVPTSNVANDTLRLRERQVK